MFAGSMIRTLVDNLSDAAAVSATERITNIEGPWGYCPAEGNLSKFYSDLSSH